ncbi:uncharacterized protein Z520_11301 [Fonsecaea multimorphosa CBS 102226]|uniref:Dol-P-Man:Man(5)GlcNAc(2)-PP-Dol alpha-1,3-mannosyltransferase n=1 Tax=Fonsecaea multimorphosa CBS 102226 TaxID=1442371 RepID=A0A0D2K9F4_9EURO|nr:uncharacterized protein Z520_11301 [Fonsecaea multimorphosa CBS 102226]KIX93028.1 hypothetical protein Z520_11301 [Fonsecaea multimorphosa CBS 102226]
MSKLSEPLKALINAAHALPGTLQAPPSIRSTYSRIAASARDKGVGIPAWVTFSTAATMTMNSPSSMVELFHLTQTLPSAPSPADTAGLMREVGLKCISFNGIPRSINCLGAFREGMPKDVFDKIPPPVSRRLTAQNIDESLARGRRLWDSVYRPFEEKLLDKLAQSHPNLPVHILNGHYSNLLADPPSDAPLQVGRVLTSLAAIACLRAQTGVGPQVVSHVFGLRKAYQDGSAEKDIEGGEWLASDEGNQWILNCIDEIVRDLNQGRGTTFAPGMGGNEEKLKAKL